MQIFQLHQNNYTGQTDVQLFIAYTCMPNTISEEKLTVSPVSVQCFQAYHPDLCSYFTSSLYDKL